MRRNNNKDGNRNGDKNGHSVTFNMARLTNNIEQETIAPHGISTPSLGPMIDNGAPYSAIGQVELLALSSLISSNTKFIDLEPIPEAFFHRTLWKYGVGAHASDARPILGSVVINVNAGDDTTLKVRHLVLSGSSQWVFGRNVTSRSNILQLYNGVMETPGYGNQRVSLPIIEYGMHIYLRLSLFICPSQPDFVSALSGTVTNTSPETVCRIVNRVHQHVCGHAEFSDIKLLLQRNNIWSDAVEDQLQRTVAGCDQCRASAKPQTSRKVSLSSLSRELNDVVCVDHFFLDGQPLFHIMDTSTRYSSALIVPNTSLNSAILAMETVWFGQFWVQNTVLGDDAFNHAEFKSFLTNAGSEFKAIPPRRHSKNVLESKHSVIRSIFNSLKHANPSSSTSILAQQAVRCSNDVYGSNIMSAFELSKGFTCPVSSTVYAISDEIIDAPNVLAAKRKSALILSSKSPFHIQLAPGDLIEVYIKNEKKKRGQWTSPKVIISYDPTTSTVTVTGLNGRFIREATEDIRHALPDESFATMICQANDELDEEVQELLDNMASKGVHGSVNNAKEYGFEYTADVNFR